jgi:DNA-binding transcriptional ArsR family regulator
MDIFVHVTESEESKVRTLDARSLRGLAHPLRMELLNALRRHGPATASMLAERLGESSGATSYHLRQLATHGFIEDAPEQGKGRERWWKAIGKGLSMDESLLRSDDPAVRGAADVFLHEIASLHGRELSTLVATRHRWLPAWDAHAIDVSDWTLRLTPELARELNSKVHELIAHFESLAPAADTPEAEQVRIHAHVFPIKTDQERPR